MKSGSDTMPLFLLDNLLRNEKKKEIVAKMPSRSRNHSLTTSSPLHNQRLNAISKEHYDNHDHNYDWNNIQSDKIPDSNQVFPSSCYLELVAFASHSMATSNLKKISCSRHRKTKITNSETPIFTTIFLITFDLCICRG